MTTQSPIPRAIIVANGTPTLRSSVTDSVGNDYLVATAQDEQHLLALVAQHNPVASIIIDLTHQPTEGLEITHRLKAHFATCTIPIIIVTDHMTPQELATAVRMGADDVIRLPIDQQELQARLIMNIRRAERDQTTNPLSMLPGNPLITRTITARLNQPLAVLYIDLDAFKIYNDTYGFERGDGLIAHTARIIARAVVAVGNTDDFVGHIGGDDFVVISTPDKAERIANQICTTFDASLADFYTPQDWARKSITHTDRQGNIRQCPIMTLSIAIMSNEKRTLTSTAQIAHIAAELKRYAKTKPQEVIGSNYVKDRRRA